MTTQILQIQEPSLILDLGASTIRMGYSGSSTPIIQSASFYGQKTSTPLPNTQESLPQNYPRKVAYLFGSELNGDNPGYSYHRLFDINPDTSNFGYTYIPELYGEDLCPRMSLDPKTFPLLIAEPNDSNSVYRSSVASMVEKTSIPKIFLVKKASLNLYACGKTNGVVLDMGAKGTSCVPVEDGYTVKSGVSKSQLGGDDLTKYVMEHMPEVSNEELLREGLVLELGKKEEYTESFWRYWRILKAQKLKEELIGFESIER